MIFKFQASSLLCLGSLVVLCVVGVTNPRVASADSTQQVDEERQAEAVAKAVAKAVFAQAEAASAAEKTDEALALYSKAKDLWAAAGDWSMVIRCLDKQIGIYAWDKAELEKARALSDEGIALASQESLPQQRAQMLGLRGSVEWLAQDLTKTEFYYKLAHTAWRTVDLDPGVGAANLCRPRNTPKPLGCVFRMRKRQALFNSSEPSLESCYFVRHTLPTSPLVESCGQPPRSLICT